LDLNIIDENNFKKKMRDLIEVCPIVVVIIIKLINIFIAYSKKIIGDVCVIGFVTCDWSWGSVAMQRNRWIHNDCDERFD